MRSYITRDEKDGYRPKLELDLNAIPAGEPVLLFQRTDFQDQALLYIQPAGKITVEAEATSERIGDQIDVYDIDLCGLTGDVYRIWHTSRPELEMHRVKSVERVHFTGDSEYDDDITVVYGKRSLEELLQDSPYRMSERYLPLIRQFIDSLAGPATSAS
jgi:hypothetical protein